MKNTAGIVTKNLSFDLILTRKPSNIIIESPADDINKKGLKNKPTIKPMAPSSCKTITLKPKCFKLKRSNSLFINGEMKYEIEYIINDKLENIEMVINKIFIFKINSKKQPL